MENSFIIYSPSSSSKPVWISFFCRTQRKIFWRKFVTRLFWGTIDFHSRKKKYYGSEWCPRTALFPTFFRISSFVFSRTKTFMQVWNYLRLSKLWQNFYFWVNYPFKLPGIPPSGIVQVLSALILKWMNYWGESFFIVWREETIPHWYQPRESLVINNKTKDGAGWKQTWWKRVKPLKAVGREERLIAACERVLGRRV